jgi:hypothetical protein
VIVPKTLVNSGFIHRTIVNFTLLEIPAARDKGWPVN